MYIHMSSKNELQVKRKLCYTESTIIPSNNSIMGVIFEYDKNQA